MSQTIESKKILPWIIMLIFFAVLNETVFTIASVSIQKTFSLSEADVSWVSVIFFITFGIGAIIFGKLADVINLRTLITFGVLLYTGASVLGFAVQSNYGLILGARAIQGLGCAALPSLVFAVAGRFIAPQERGKAFGLITSFIAVSVGFGPVIGGLVSNNLSWTLLFLVPLPVLLAIKPLRDILPDEKSRSIKIDIIGAILVALSVGFVALLANKKELVYGILFLVSFILLLINLKTSKNPFIPLDLFKNTKFTVSIVVGFLMFAVVLSSFFLLPQLFKGVYKLDEATTGLLLFPGAFFPFFIGRAVGGLADKKGNYFVVCIGLVLISTFMLAIGIVGGLSQWAILGLMIGVNAGFAFFQTGLMNSLSQFLPEHEIGIGMGLFNMISIISGAIGVAVVGGLLTDKTFPNPVFDFMSNSANYNNILLILSGIVILASILYMIVFFKTRGPQAQASHGHH